MNISLILFFTLPIGICLIGVGVITCVYMCVALCKKVDHQLCRLLRLCDGCKCCWKKPVILNVNKPVGTPTHPAVVSSLRKLYVRPACNSGTNENQGERNSAFRSGTFSSQAQPEANTNHKRSPSREQLPFIIHTPDCLTAVSRTRHGTLHEQSCSSPQSTSRQLGRADARRNTSTLMSNRDYRGRSEDRNGDPTRYRTGYRSRDLITGDRSGGRSRDRSRDGSRDRIRGRKEFNVYNQLSASTVVRPSNGADVDHRSSVHPPTGARDHSRREEQVLRSYSVNSSAVVTQNHNSHTSGYLMTGSSVPPPWGARNRLFEPSLPPRYEDVVHPSYSEAISKLEPLAPTYI